MSSITARQETPERRGSRAGQSARPRRLVFSASDVIVLIVINAAL
ncbi:MAG: hypothetical protein QOH92_873, partial [Chloroflexota bacterium]|nr:hypothetical protein [Chloroflexota bacterium]